ncbi:uncharacterized protein KY384_004809 [Bacidia gigantensis]|uniref:uncharacterized protein n=1 Tax=Bacidia gigantensis TaxID=2732470 RepID=UPI001D03690D|nr:uncharacterized protein KY384_004809 [Bacidia gigantensis]KAG8530307.1 hypothetical protein KY384_004809 [Bacidia gigantensis]
MCGLFRTSKGVGATIDGKEDQSPPTLQMSTKRHGVPAQLNNFSEIRAPQPVEDKNGVKIYLSASPVEDETLSTTRHIEIKEYGKCDGQQPSCGRCTGFGYVCTWARRKGIGRYSPPVQSPREGHFIPSSDALSENGGTENNALLSRLMKSYESLIQSFRPKLSDAESAAMELSLESIRRTFPHAKACTMKTSNLESEPDDTLVTTPTYLGKASEIHFVDTVMDSLYQQKKRHPKSRDTSESNDRRVDLLNTISMFESPLRLPSKECGLDYLDVYFSTIHVAYPFLNKPLVIHHAHRVLSGDLKQGDLCPWLALLNRLLALQLGRPTAIHETDFAVLLPSRIETNPIEANTKDMSPQLELGDSESDDGEDTTLGEENGAESERQASTMDYFLSVIQLSRILGQVIRELYHPTQVEASLDDMLISTSTINESLVAWKISLPYHLRFDWGHTFEKSKTFKRQRDNLHLSGLLEKNSNQIDRAEKICINEAQQTARLLYDVDHERNLIQDFPWWQMVSCILCASSILLVADSCLINEGNCAEMLHQDFRKDAENCLKVFEALSVDSEAIQRAKTMLKGVAERQRLTDAPCKIRGKSQLPPVEAHAVNASLNLPVASNIDTDSALAFPLDSVDSTQNVDWLSQWPSEISDTMQWSAQFFDATFDPGQSSGGSPYADGNVDNSTIGA